MDNPYLSDDEDDDLDDYGEKFSEHELNVYSCIRSATVDKYVNKSAISFESPEKATDDVLIDVKEKIDPSISILPKKPDYEALRKHFALLPVDRQQLKTQHDGSKQRGC